MEEKIKEYALNVLKGGEQLTKAEMPIYVQEYLNFEFYNHVIAYSLCLILTVGFVFWAIIIPYKKNEKCGNFAALFLAVLSIWFVCFFIETGKEIIKIKLAPRTYLVDKFTCENN